MSERQFGARLTSEGTSFRLWAPAAKRVDLLLEKPQPLRRGDDGWFSAEIPNANAGTRYKFRIDDEIDPVTQAAALCSAMTRASMWPRSLARSPSPPPITG